MALEEKIAHDLVTAQKAGEALRVGTLRFVIAQIRNRAIEKRSKGNVEPLTDAEVLEVIQREAKKRRESITMFQNGGRADLARKEEEELHLIGEYLPKMMDAEEVRAVVQEIVKKNGGDFKNVMRMAMSELKGKADGKLVSDIVTELTK